MDNPKEAASEHGKRVEAAIDQLCKAVKRNARDCGAAIRVAKDDIRKLTICARPAPAPSAAPLNLLEAAECLSLEVDRTDDVCPDDVVRLAKELLDVVRSTAIAEEQEPAPAPSNLVALLAEAESLLWANADWGRDWWWRDVKALHEKCRDLATSAPVAVQVPEVLARLKRILRGEEDPFGSTHLNSCGGSSHRPYRDRHFNLPCLDHVIDTLANEYAASASEPAPEPDLSTIAPPEPISDEDKARVVESAEGQRQRADWPSAEDECPDPTEAAATSGSQTSGTSAEGSMATSSKPSAGLLAESANILGIIDAERAALGRPAESGVLSHCLAIRRFRRAIAEEERGADDVQCDRCHDWEIDYGKLRKERDQILKDLAEETDRHEKSRKDAGFRESQLRKELEHEQIRLAACGVAAMANLDGGDPDRLAPDHPSYSASYGDVCRAVDREVALRKELEATKKRENDGVELFDKLVADLRKKLEAAKAERGAEDPCGDCPVAVRRRARAAAERGEDVLRGWMRENDDFVNFDQRKHGDNDVLAELVRRELARGGGAK